MGRESNISGVYAQCRWHKDIWLGYLVMNYHDIFNRDQQLLCFSSEYNNINIIPNRSWDTAKTLYPHSVEVQLLTKLDTIIIREKVTHTQPSVGQI